MALKLMILIPPELWENRFTSSPPPVKKILNSKDHSFDKWTQVRVHQDPYLRTEKQKRDPIPIPIIETDGTPNSKPTFKAKRKRIIGSVPVFNTETVDNLKLSGSVSPVHTKYIKGVLKRKVSHDPTFGVYQNNDDGSFKTGSSKLKFSNKHVFVDGKWFKATRGLWELLTKPRPDKNSITHRDKLAYKQVLLHSNEHKVNFNPTGKIKPNKGVKYTQFISRLLYNSPEQNIEWTTVE
jgi:hypothetical protein